MIEQPRRGDGEEAWRRYAGELRQALGEMNGRLTTDAIREIESRARAAERKLEQMRAKWSRGENTLDRVERHLLAGEVADAGGVLAKRRRRIEKAQRRTERRGSAA